jgi:hypothetical protein
MIQKTITNFDPSLTSIFGTLETAELTPIFQADFVHGLNNQQWATASVSGTGATVDTNLGRLRVQSGTVANNYAYVNQLKTLRYRAGEGMVTRFTPVFNTGVANNLQLIGIGSIVSNAPYDGYFFGYSGVTFGISHYNAGTLINFYPQTSWTGDQCNGNGNSSFNYIPQNGSPVMIKYPYLGYGNIEFFILSPLTSSFVLAHTIQYANTTNLVQLSNPTLQFEAFTSNTTNTTNVTMYVGSVSVFISGARSFVSNPKGAASGRKAAITTQTNVLAIRNCNTYNGVTNRGMVRLNCLSVGWDSANDTALLNIIKNPTLGGSPSYTPINGSTADNGVTLTAANNITSFDIAGTTITGGTVMFNLAFARNTGIPIDLTPFDLTLEAGSIYSFAITGDSSGAARVAVNWTEDI